MTAPTPTVQQPEQDPQRAESVDVTAVAAALAAALAALILAWAAVKATWVAELVRQIASAIRDDDLTRLGKLTVDSSHGATVLQQAMTQLAATAASHVVAEAQAQGVHGVHPVEPPSEAISTQATVAAELLAAALATSAGSEAIRVRRPLPLEEGGSTADETARLVQKHLDALTDAQPIYVLGGALMGATNLARVLTLLGSADLANYTLDVYASEVLDTNTCGPCFDVHGTRLGSSESDFKLLHRLYPVRGYIDCLGRDRCRGVPVGIWRPRAN